MGTETPTLSRRQRLQILGAVAGVLAVAAGFITYTVAMHHDYTISSRVASAIALAASRAGHAGPFGRNETTLIEEHDRETFTAALARYNFSVVKRNDHFYTVIVARSEKFPRTERLIYPKSTGVNVYFNKEGAIADLSEAKEFRQ